IRRDLFFRNSGSGFVKVCFLSSCNGLELKLSNDKERYKLMTERNSGRGRLLLLNNEKSSREALVISVSGHRRSSYIKVTSPIGCFTLFACLENSTEGKKTLLKRLRTGHVFTSMKKRQTNNTVAFIFL